MKRLEKSPVKFPKLHEIPGWRKEKPQDIVDLKPIVMGPYKVSSKKELYLSPRYPKEVKFPLLHIPIPVQTKLEKQEEHLLEVKLFEIDLPDIKNRNSLINPAKRSHSLTSIHRQSDFSSFLGEDFSKIQLRSRASVSSVPTSKPRKILHKKLIHSDQIDSENMHFRQQKHIGGMKKPNEFLYKGLEDYSIIRTSSNFYSKGHDNTVRVVNDKPNTIGIENLNFDLLKPINKRYENSQFSDYPILDKKNETSLDSLHVNTKDMISLPIEAITNLNMSHEYDRSAIRIKNEDSYYRQNKGFTQSLDYKLDLSSEFYTENQSNFYIGNNVKNEYEKKSTGNSLKKATEGYASESSDSPLAAFDGNNPDSRRFLNSHDTKSRLHSKDELSEEKNRLTITLKAAECYSDFSITETKSLNSGQNVEIGTENSVNGNSGKNQLKNIEENYLKETPETIQKNIKTKLADSSKYELKQISTKKKGAEVKKLQIKNVVKYLSPSSKKGIKSIKSTKPSPLSTSRSKSPKNKQPKQKKKLDMISLIKPSKTPRPAIKSPKLKTTPKPIKKPKHLPEIKLYNVEGQNLVISINKEDSPRVSESEEVINTAQLPLVTRNSTVSVPLQQSLSINSNTQNLVDDALSINNQPSGLVDLSKKNSLGIISTNYNYFRNLYGIYKDPIGIFINNFSRSLFFKIKLISEPQEINNEEVKPSKNNDSFEKSEILREKRLRLEKALTECEQQKELLDQSSLAIKNKIVTSVSLLTPSQREFISEKDVVGLDKEEIQQLLQQPQKKKSVLDKFKNLPKSYVKKSQYIVAPIRKNSFSIVGKKKESESSESFTFDSESESSSDMNDSNPIDVNKSLKKNDFLRSSALYEAEHFALTKSIAESIFIFKPKGSVINRYSIMSPLPIPELNDSFDRSREIRSPVSPSQRIPAENPEINKADLNIFTEPTPSRYMFFKHDACNFFPIKTERIGDEKLLVENNFDIENMKRLEIKNKFIKQLGKHNEEEFEEYSYLKIISAQELITEKVDASRCKNLDSLIEKKTVKK